VTVDALKTFRVIGQGHSVQAGHSPGKPGKVGEFQSGQGKWKSHWNWNLLKSWSWSCCFWQLVGLDFGYVHHWHSCSF